MYKTIVFDLDGTLLDTLDDLTTAVNFALKNNGLPKRTKDEVCAFVGNGIKNLILRAIGENASADFEKVFSDFKEYYKERCADETKPYAGILQLLTQLKRRGVKTAVLSNKADFATKKLAKAYFPDLLDEAEGENEEQGIRKKPAPDGLFLILEKLNARAEETAYVGDSEVDILTAKNAGVDCISCTWGFREKEFLLQKGAKTLVEFPEEILKFCE